MRRLSDAVHAFLKSRYFYPLVFVACALPFVLLVWQALPVFAPLVFPDVTLPWESDLGANPAEELLHRTGRDALALLLIALSITPIRRLTGWNRVQYVRRMVGVWSFFYACCHLLAYAGLNQLFDLAAILDDVFKRRFIFVGMFTFSILLVLAATSTNGMMRRLGRNWQRLHRLVYVAGIAGVVHFAWGQKADISEPLQWGAFLALILGIRVFFLVRKQRARLVPAVSR
jgi:methionine sulfoxide reductase heme-binding subunit